MFNKKINEFTKVKNVIQVLYSVVKYIWLSFIAVFFGYYFTWIYITSKLKHNSIAVNEGLEFYGIIVVGRLC